MPLRTVALLVCSLLVGFWLGNSAHAAESAQPAKRPNILLIYADDQSCKTLSCYPGAFPYVKTPHIDALAAAGVRFSGCYLGSWCMPSRASMLTGRLPHGIESMRMSGKYPGSSYDPAQCPFWPAVFRKHGYHTAQIGKWHTGVDTGPGRDWDHQIVWNRPKHPENAGNYYGQQLLSTNGGEDRLTEGYTTDNYTQWACDYIRGEHRDAAKPWYLWLCYGAIHGPSTPAPRHKGLYKDAQVPIPADIFGPRPQKPAYLEKMQAWAKGPDGAPVMGKSGEKFGDDSAKNPRTFAQWHQQMNECVPAIDEGVGKLIATLKETGQLENTLVVYTTDQGFGMGEHGFRTKLGPYESTYRSPLIVMQPGKIPAGKVCEQPTTGVDLVVTFFAQAGIELPWTMHGHDLSPLLANPAAPWPHAALFEHMGEHYGRDTAARLKEGPVAHSNVPWWVGLRQGNYKYVRTLVASEMEELYDVVADPEELTNLALLPAHAERLASFRAATLAELKRTEAPFLDLLPKTAAMSKP